MLLLHAPGNAFIRDLKQGESLLVQAELADLPRHIRPGCTCTWSNPRNMGFAFWRTNWDYRNIMVRLIGPGRGRGQLDLRAGPREMEAIRKPLLRHAPAAGRPPLVDGAARAGYPWVVDPDRLAEVPRQRRDPSLTPEPVPAVPPGGGARRGRASGGNRRDLRGAGAPRAAAALGLSGWKRKRGCWSRGRCPRASPMTRGVNHPRGAHRGPPA